MKLHHNMPLNPSRDHRYYTEFMAVDTDETEQSLEHGPRGNETSTYGGR